MYQEELEAEVQNLRRELALMTTAWYDMVTRLQSNTVVLQRRNEAPKSFIARQRMAVAGNGRSGGAVC
jgi:protein HOOK3